MMFMTGCQGHKGEDERPETWNVLNNSLLSTCEVLDCVSHVLCVAFALELVASYVYAGWSGQDWKVRNWNLDHMDRRAEALNHCIHLAVLYELAFGCLC